MNFRNLDILQLRKYITDQLYYVTCVNCCKYYVVPTTATCGHSLCHTCWRGRQCCPSCTSQVDKKALRLNSSLQSLIEHALMLKRSFESLFDIQLDDFTLATDEQQHVKDWLASSQNHFSAPVTNSEQFTEEKVKPLHQITSEIQIHTMNKKVKEPERETIKKNVQQEDWDKIEEMPEKDPSKSLENAVGPMDIETYEFLIDDKAYSANNPRRSSRNKELKNSKSHNITNDVSSDKESGKSFNMDSGKTSNKIGQNWKNVKKMKKEFSKLNKKNKNKLNISIEMCKKAKPAVNLGGPSKSQQMSYNIDENTPEVPVTDEVETKNTDFNTDQQLNTYKVNSLAISASERKHILDNGALPHVQHPINLHLQNKSKENIKQTNQNITASKVCFFKRGPLQTTSIDTNNTQVINIDNPTVQNKTTDKVDTGDIEITIKIGKILTNICIQKKEDAVQFKINTDREVQTSMVDPVVENEHSMQSVEVDTKTQHVRTGTNDNIVNTPIDVPLCSQSSTSKVQIEKSMSTKKNTTSADTSTAPFEITDSEEKEFADHMENVPFVKSKTQSQKSISKSECSLKSKLSAKIDGNTSKSKNGISLIKKIEAIPEDLEFLEEVDIFEDEAIKEGNIQPLESAKSTHSAIIMPTIKSKLTLEIKNNKRSRDMCDTEDLSNNKKMKIPEKYVADSKKTQEEVFGENNVMDTETENTNNYDAIMSQVFANIDADMENLPKTGTSAQRRTEISNTHKSNNNTFAQLLKDNCKQDNSNKQNNQKHCEEANQKCSENVFSLLDKEDSHSEIFKTISHKSLGQTQQGKVNQLKQIASVPIVGMTVIENEGKLASPKNIDIVEFGTPIQDDDDRSIVEETPQKSTSLIKNKNKNEVTTITDNAVVAQCSSTEKDKSTKESCNQQKDTHIEDSMNVISVSDSTCEISEIRKTELDTPLTINKFFDKVTHKSTPFARKSLSFSRNVENDLEDTMCPSSVVAAKTTQEREFMSKAFEQTLGTQSQTLGNQRGKVKLCIAGSCLMSSEQAILKELCVQRNWTYVDKYTNELTHLVVGVDEENKSQRSVKYICALAHSNWIVTFAWVEKCLLVKGHADEEPFEALDATGEPGPRRSRLSKTKLLQGITFYCMEPFSIIDTNTLKDVLLAAGGRVASEASGVRASSAPSMLLAEPESTQENRFIYLAMELKVVPVNYEWALNCLGTYTLKPIYDLLLCPAGLLPWVIVNSWPPELITPCDDD